MGGGGAGPPANRGPRLVRRAYKACYFWHFFSFSADYAAESHRGCRGRVLSLPGLLWNETRAPSILLLGRRWCIAGVFQQKVSSGCPPPPEVEEGRLSLRGEDRQCLGGGRWRPGPALVTLCNEDAS